jgi:hypothetical protein
LEERGEVRRGEERREGRRE